MKRTLTVKYYTLDINRQLIIIDKCYSYFYLPHNLQTIFAIQEPENFDV